MGPTYSVQGALHTGSCKVQAHDCIAGFRGMCRQAITVHLGQSQVLLCFPGYKSNMLTKTFPEGRPTLWSTMNTAGWISFWS